MNQKYNQEEKTNCVYSADCSEYSIQNSRLTKPNRTLVYTYSIFFSAVIIVLIIQATWQSNSWVANIYIQDSYTLYEELKSIVYNNTSMEEYINSTEDSRTICFIYMPLYLALAKSSIAFIFQNIIMASFSIFAAYQAFNKFGEKAAFLSSLAISANPYIWISVAGISKEIVLICISTTLLMIFIREINLRSFWISLLCYFSYGVRPFYGFALALYFLPCLILSNHNFSGKDYKKIFRIALVIIPFIMVASFSVLREYIPLLNRMMSIQQDLDAGTTFGQENLERAKSSIESGAFYACFDLIFRSLANMFSLIIRPGLTTENNHIALLGSGYLIYGLLLSVSMSFIFITFLNFIFNRKFDKAKSFQELRNEEQIMDLLYLVLYMIFMTSTSLIIQPRYLMPILPISMGILGMHSWKHIKISLMAIMILSMLGYIYLTFIIGVEPLKIQESGYKPDFLL